MLTLLKLGFQHGRNKRGVYDLQVVKIILPQSSLIIIRSQARKYNGVIFI